MGEIVRAVLRIVLQVEPATHLRMPPVAEPTRRIERRGLRIGGTSDAVAGVREGILRAPKRAPRERVLGQDAPRQRLIERSLGAEDRSEHPVSERISQGAPFPRCSPDLNRVRATPTWFGSTSPERA